MLFLHENCLYRNASDKNDDIYFITNSGFDSCQWWIYLDKTEFRLCSETGRQKKFLISGNVKFIFHFKVPQIVVHFDHEPLNCSHHNDYAAHQKCMHFRGSVHAIYDLYQDMANVLYGRLTEAREMLLQLPR